MSIASALITGKTSYVDAAICKYSITVLQISRRPSAFVHEAVPQVNQMSDYGGPALDILLHKVIGLSVMSDK